MGEDENRRRGQIGLAMLGLTLVVAALLSVWSAATGGSAPGGSARGAAAAEVGAAGRRTQVANRLAHDPARAAGGDPGAPVGFACTRKACDLCEQSGASCTPLADKPGRCTCP